MEHSHGADHPDTENILIELANCYFKQQKFAAAEPLFARALAVRETGLGPKHPDTATMMNNLALVYDHTGKHAAAEELLKKVLRVYEESLGPDNPLTANALSNLAGLYQRQANYVAAEPLYRRVLKVYDKEFGPDAAVSVRTLNSLGDLYHSQGKFRSATPLFERALKICEKSYGEDHPETADCLNSLAEVYRNEGNYAAALPLYQRALVIAEKTLGPVHPNTGHYLNNLALLYAQHGNYPAAETLYRRSLKAYEEVLGTDHSFVGGTLHNLAGLRESQRAFADAEQLYLRSLTIRNNALGPDHPDTAITAVGLGGLYQRAGDFVASEKYYQRALKTYKKAFGVDHPFTAGALSSLARLRQFQGNLTAAEQLNRQALQIQERLLGSQHPHTTETLQNLATVLLAMGKSVEAYALTDRARRGTRSHIVRVLPALSEPEQALFLTHRYTPSLHGSLSLGIAKPEEKELVELSASWLINGKAVAQEALAQRNLLSRGVNDPKTATVVTHLQQVRAQLAKLAMTVAGAEKTQARHRLSEKLTADEQRLSQQLVAAVPGGSTEITDWIELDQIRKALPTKGVLIDVVSCRLFNFAAKETEERWSPAHYAVWITYATPEKGSILVDLGVADEIDTLVATLRKAIGNSGGAIKNDGEEQASAALKAELQAVATKIWEPLEPHLSDVDQIVLSPDGALWLVPWSALPVGDDDEFLLEKYTLRLLVSGRDLVTKPETFATRQPVIVADPNFDQEVSEKRSSIQAIFKQELPADNTTTRSFSAKSVLPNVNALPSTGLEATAIQPNVEKYAGEKAILYKERYALERVAKALRHPKLVSFATHGFFLPTQKSTAKDPDQLGSSGTRSVALDTSGKPIENPLLRCGLLLSGCNNRDSVVGDDDGILTGLEIVGIDFRGTELVVLSACETGIGEVQNGEGVAGLRQAFQLAGAQSVVSSLWNVADGETARLMQVFFHNLANGMNKSEALRQAQLARIKARRERNGAAHPFFWAAFTLTGQE